jgi:hypothetical protein
MNKTNDYSNAPSEVAEELENSVAIDDFLPSPGSIAESLKKQVTVPVTMKLKKDTVDRYKRYAKKTESNTRLSFQPFWIRMPSSSKI